MEYEESEVKEISKLIKQKLENKESVMEDLIGVGTFAKVYKLFLPEINKNIALKVFPKNLSKAHINPYLNFLKNIKKPFFAKIYDYIEDDNNYYIIMEYYQLI